MRRYLLEYTNDENAHKIKNVESDGCIFRRRSETTFYMFSCPQIVLCDLQVEDYYIVVKGVQHLHQKFET